MKLFVEVSPAFYKTLLFNEINKKEKILVVYREDPKRPFRDDDFLAGDKEFNYLNLSGKTMAQVFSFIKVLKSDKYDEVIIGGYENIFCWIAAFMSSRLKNGIIVESTYRETKKSGFKVFLKKLFFKRCNKAYVCGKSHADLVKAFGFKGQVIDIGSVGFIRRVPQPPYEERSTVSKFLFVGRLIPVKNLEWLIERFIQHPELELTIVGTGELESRLREIAPSNVILIGQVPNTKLFEYYQKADVFVLPSITETYGLVVEESLNNGTPVLVSHMVGCQDNLVAANNVGRVFQLNDIEDFESKLADICNTGVYNQLRERISNLDFEKFEQNMVNSFLR